MALNNKYSINSGWGKGPGPGMMNMGNFNAPTSGGGSLSTDYATDFGFDGVGIPGAGGETEGGFMDNMLGEDGWGNLALSGVSAGLQGFMGMKQLGLAKDQLNFQKQSFNKNYDAQKRTTNTQLRDRQAQRHRQNPNTYVSPSEYMKQNGIR